MYGWSGCKSNQDHFDWEQKDQLLISWLLLSMSKELLTRMVECLTFLFLFFLFSDLGEIRGFLYCSNSCKDCSNSKHRIKSSQKVSLSMHDYLWHIKGIIDDLYNSWLFYLYFISYWSKFLGFTHRVWHLDHLYYHMLWYICYQPYNMISYCVEKYFNLALHFKL